VDDGSIREAWLERLASRLWTGGGLLRAKGEFCNAQPSVASDWNEAKTMCMIRMIKMIT
jgi:hypothetical protein